MRMIPPMLLSLAALLGAAALARQDDGDGLPPLPEGVEVLTRGPVHEAFAEPVAFDPRPGMVAPKAPPELIEEMPPEEKPEGENVVWVPGYWAWDTDREDFLWVSGIWRDMPPGRQWVPGYWEEAGEGGGYQWVNGYWIDAEAEEVTYLPQPPATLEEGPSAPQPSQQHAWSPGYWYWVEEEYVWRPGYWFELRPDWVWVPAHYVWTPAGCVFVPGYWDYVVAQRGLLFAPVYVPQPVIAQPQFVYTPTVVIRDTVLVDHFWVQPNYGQYYFGDYYGPAYQQQGFSYWAQPAANLPMYDPIFVQRNFALAQQDPGWLADARQVYQMRVRDEAYRPPRTFLAQRQLRARRADLPSELLMAAPLAAVAAGRFNAPSPRSGAVAALARAETNRVRFERVGEARRAELTRRTVAVREFQQQRRQREAQLATEFRRDRGDRTRDAQVKAAQAERIEDVREKAAARNDRLRDARDRAQEKGQQARAARAVRLDRSPLAARAAARRGPDGAPGAGPPPAPGPRPDRDGPGAPRARADRPDFPKGDRRDLPKAERPKGGEPGRIERMRPPFPAPGAPDGPGRDRPKGDRPAFPKADRPRPGGRPDFPKADRPAAPKANRPDFPKADRPALPKADRPALPKGDRPAAPKAIRPERPKAAAPPAGAARAERMRPPFPALGARGGPGSERPRPFGGPRAGQEGSPGPRPGGVADRLNRARPMPPQPPPGIQGAQRRPGFPGGQPRPEPPRVQPRPDGPNRPGGPAGLTRFGTRFGGDGNRDRPRLGGPGPRPGGPPDRPRAQPSNDRPRPNRDAQPKAKAQGKRQRQGNDD